jgi:hypothetical protein
VNEWKTNLARGADADISGKFRDVEDLDMD